MGRSRWVGAWLAVGLGVIVGVAPALADDPVTFQDDAGVGATLPAPTAVVIAAPAAPVSPATTARYLRPFPVIRVAGSSVSGGAYINVLRITAPRGTHVAISCLGRGCPVRRLSRGPGRIPQLERFLPVGVGITIRATRRGYIGKYVSFLVRSHAAPMRRDACLMPGGTRPAPCP